MHKKIIFLTIALCFLLSCSLEQLIEINGYGDDYEDLSEEQKSIIKPLVSFKNIDNNNVYKINPEQLKDELSKQPKSIVKLVSTVDCEYYLRKPLSYYEDFAKENGYKLYIIMTTYYPFNFVMSQHPENTIFVLDYDYYDERQRVICERYFNNELIGLPIDTPFEEIPKDKIGSTYYYEYGKLLKIEE